MSVESIRPRVPAGAMADGAPVNPLILVTEMCFKVFVAMIFTTKTTATLIAFEGSLAAVNSEMTGEFFVAGESTSTKAAESPHWLC